MRNRSNLLKLAAAATMAVSMQCAYADDWAFSYFDTGGGTAAFGSGTFVTGSVGPAYTVTGISGFANGQAITRLSSWASADQLLWPTAPFFDSAGISFHTAGGPDWNLAYLSGGFNGISFTGDIAINSSLDPGTALVHFDAINMSVTAVPEPETYAMMLAGLGLMGFMARRRKQNAAA
jgi:hypothetical protein